MTDIDLFGDQIAETALTKTGRKRVSGTRAYPAMPGTGPEGMTCRGCDHYRSVCGGARSFPKCELMRLRWSHGPGTDIKAGSPACSKFKPRNDNG